MKINLRISLLIFATLIILVSCRKQDVGNTASLAGTRTLTTHYLKQKK